MPEDDYRLLPKYRSRVRHVPVVRLIPEVREQPLVVEIAPAGVRRRVVIDGLQMPAGRRRLAA